MTAGEIEHLRQMANQIAANFSFHEDQVARIADHLSRFWAPSMCRMLQEYIEQDGEHLDAAVLEAAEKLRKA